MPDQGQILSAVDDYANAVAANAVADQQATDKAAYDQLQAAFDAYKASHPDPSNPTPPQPKPPVSTCVFGSSLGVPLPDPSTVLPAFRYYQPGATWDGKLAAQYKTGTRVFVIDTYKNTPTQLANLCKTAPADAVLYITVKHEPDDDIDAGTLSVATWVANMNAAGKAIKGLPNVFFGPIHNGWQPDDWAPHEQGLDWSLITFWGADRYSHNYEDPKTQFEGIRAYAASKGLPLVIGETGSDTTDVAKQKAFAAQVHAWGSDPANNAAVICWWNQSRDVMANADVQHAFLGA